eukprot:5319493-Amphidinium_carterae.1
MPTFGIHPLILFWLLFTVCAYIALVFIKRLVLVALVERQRVPGQPRAFAHSVPKQGKQSAHHSHFF